MIIVGKKYKNKRVLKYLFLALFLLAGCINRTYKVEIYNYNGVVTFRAEVLAEVPHSTTVNPEVDVVPF